MDAAEIKKRLTAYYATSESYYDKLEEVFQDRRDRAFRVGSLDLLGYVRGAESILDVGCGSGVLLAFIKQSFPGKRCCGLDVRPIAIEKAVRMARNQGLDIDLRIADIEMAVPYPENTFDLIIAHEVCEHFVDPLQAVRNISRLLGRKGRLIMIAPNRWIRSSPKIVLPKMLDFVRMALDRNYLRVTITEPPLDGVGEDRDAVYLTNPYEMRRMVRMAGLKVIKGSVLKCRLVAGKP
jgi:SAM-dependent methyltransferase